MAQKMQISDFLVKKMLVFYNFLWIIVEKVTFWMEFPLSSMKNSKSPWVYVLSFLNMLHKSIFIMEFLKLFYINFDTLFHIFPINHEHYSKYTIKISIIDFFYLISLLHLILFHLHLISISFWHNVAKKYFIFWY